MYTLIRDMTYVYMYNCYKDIYIRRIRRLGLIIHINYTRFDYLLRDRTNTPYVVSTIRHYLYCGIQMIPEVL